MHTTISQTTHLLGSFPVLDKWVQTQVTLSIATAPNSTPFQRSSQQTHARRAAPWHRQPFWADWLFQSQYQDVKEAGRAGQRSQKRAAWNSNSRKQVTEGRACFLNKYHGCQLKMKRKIPRDHLEKNTSIWKGEWRSSPSRKIVKQKIWEVWDLLIPSAHNSTSFFIFIF